MEKRENLIRLSGAVLARVLPMQAWAEALGEDDRAEDVGTDLLDVLSGFVAEARRVGAERARPNALLPYLVETRRLLESLPEGCDGGFAFVQLDKRCGDLDGVFERFGIAA